MIVPVALPTREVEATDDTVEQAEATCNAFLDLNGIDRPTYDFKDASGGNLHGVYNRPSRTVHVFVRGCKQGGAFKSRPGYWEDVSIVGVTAHEVAHHVDHELRLGSSFYDVYQHESPVGNNAQVNRHEDLADALLLYIRNPDLLLTLCPMRHTFLSKRLKATETRSWREVLSKYPECVKEVEKRLKP
jgi:hypothetical protein